MSDATVQGFSPEIATDIQHVIEHIEGNHGDSLAFIASLATGGTVGETRVARLDPDGVTFEHTARGGRHRLDFGAPVASMPELQVQLFGFLTRARDETPDHPVTSIEVELQTTQSLTTHRGTLVDRRLVAPNMVELTIGGLDGMPVLGGDEFFYLMVGTADRPLVVAAGATMSEIQALDEGEQPIGASYTTRRRRPELGELDVWVLLHGHDGGVSGWADTAEVGAEVALWGPRSAAAPPDGTTRHLMVCDETGVPAVCAIVDGLPDGHPVDVVALVDDEAHRLPVPDRASVRWLHRSEVGNSVDVFSDSVRELAGEIVGLYAFGAGESRQISTTRRLLRHELGAEASQVHMTGYWRSDG
ncbi:MAG: siderophore-interacting protein [Actinomycetota bacterium]